MMDMEIWEMKHPDFERPIGFKSRNSMSTNYKCIFLKSTQKFFLLVLVSIICHSVRANSCYLPDEKNWIPIVQKYIEKSEAIFIGDVIGKKENLMLVKVIEVFKGNITYDTLLFDTKFEYPYDEERNRNFLPWALGVNIFYAESIHNEVFTQLLIDKSCGMSRDLSSLYPMIPPDNLSGMVGEVEFQKGEILLVKNWVNEYALLNAYRNNHQKAEGPQSSKSDYLSYLSVALSVVAVLVAFFRKQR